MRVPTVSNVETLTSTLAPFQGSKVREPGGGKAPSWTSPRLAPDASKLTSFRLWQKDQRKVPARHT